MVGRAVTRVRLVKLWGAQFKEVDTLRVVQVQGWCLTCLTLLLDGCYLKNRSVVSKNGNIDVHILSHDSSEPLTRNISK